MFWCYTKQYLKFPVKVKKLCQITINLFYFLLNYHDKILLLKWQAINFNRIFLLNYQVIFLHVFDRGFPVNLRFFFTVKCVHRMVIWLEASTFPIELNFVIHLNVSRFSSNNYDGLYFFSHTWHGVKGVPFDTYFQKYSKSIKV